MFNKVPQKPSELCALLPLLITTRGNPALALRARCLFNDNLFRCSRPSLLSITIHFAKISLITPIARRLPKGRWRGGRDLNQCQRAKGIKQNIVRRVIDRTVNLTSRGKYRPNCLSSMAREKYWHSWQAAFPSVGDGKTSFKRKNVY